MQAGASRLEITPPKGAPMGGYLARTKPAEDVHDPLFARALVLDDGAQRVAIVTADLLAFEPAAASAIRQRIEQATGIPPSHTMLALSHTHSGPIVAASHMGQPAAPYVEELHDKLVAVVRAAAERLRPAGIGAGRAKVYLGVNRRMRAADNRVVLGKNPAGYASPYAHILVASELGGGPLALLFTYGAHPVVLGPENLLISGDYAGCAERIVEGNFGDTAVALFALGFAGDVNANFEERDFDEVETFGGALGRAVLEEMKAIELTADAPLQARSLRVPLPLLSPPPIAEAQRVLYEERDRLTRLLGRGEDSTAINERRAMVEWAADLVRLAGENRPEHTVELEIQVFTLGRIALVALSAEVFAEYAKLLDELSPFAHTFPIGNANGDIGYVPTAAACEVGGYEIETAPRLLGTLAFRPQVEGIIRQALADLLAEMARKNH